jgi:nucleotide sugar dehydrogenase
MADVSASLGVDITEVIDAASTKPYGFMRFTPGAGVGGHCIPCDPHYLLWQLRGERVPAPLIEQSMSAISRRPLRVIDRAKDILAGGGIQVRGSRILLVGVAYKPGVADVRESPAIEIVKQLHRLGASVAFTDTMVPSMKMHDGSVSLSLSAADLDPAGFDLAIVNTKHPHTDHTWLDAMPLVLDATFSMDQTENVFRL